jgi:lipoprotein-anchoring transpeptidase ErfK/SrfK
MARRRSILAACATALLCAAPAAAQVPLPPLGGGGQPPPDQGQQPSDPPQQQPASGSGSRSHKKPKPVYAAVSNERTRTLWGHPLELAIARVRPRSGARGITRLHWNTEDGYPEVYVVLARYTDSARHEWLKVRLPMRPNGRTGWVPRSALGGLQTVDTFLRVDKRSLRATLYRHGRAIWRAPVGIGKPGTETPSGRFYIRERLRVGSSGSLYGPLAFGTSAYSKLTDWPGGGVIGIHGTNEPALVPGRPSHGCIRVRNGDIVRLGRLMPIGTPVRIG